MDMYKKREQRKKNRENKEIKQDNNSSSMNINWYPGHMAKAKRLIMDDIKLIDVVIELLDARIPLASQNPDIKEIIGNKKKIVVLNKCDLSDDRENKRWVNYFKEKGITAILTDANTGTGINNVTKEIQNVMAEELKANADKGRVGKTIRVLILGIPNVGKSSFINRIAKRNTAIVGNKPGVTKQKQWIRLKDNVELLDTPGVLWPKLGNQKTALDLAFTGTIKDEILEKTEVAYYLLKFLLENYPERVQDRYKIEKEQIDEILAQDAPENFNIMDIMYLIGKKRGAIVSGGNIDEAKVANLLLDDFRSGKMGRITVEKVRG